MCGRELTLELSQETAPTPGQPAKRALPIPVTVGLLDSDGRTQAFLRDGVAMDETVVVLDGPKAKVVLSGVEERPVVSALRRFSAPVKLSTDADARDRYVLLAGDPDLFNRWEAGQELARTLILGRATGRADETPSPGGIVVKDWPIGCFRKLAAISAWQRMQAESPT